MTFDTTVFAIALVIGVLLAETRLSMRNEAALRARGAIEARGDVYVAMSILYPLAFLLMGAEGMWRSSKHNVQGARRQGFGDGTGVKGGVVRVEAEVPRQRRGARHGVRRHVDHAVAKS